MDATTFIEPTLEECKRRLYRTLRDLTAEELTWQPGPEANSIGFIVWHVARAHATSEPSATFPARRRLTTGLDCFSASAPNVSQSTS